MRLVQSGIQFIRFSNVRRTVHVASDEAFFYVTSEKMQTCEKVSSNSIVCAIYVFGQ